MTMIAMKLVSFLLVNDPMKSRLGVNMTSAIMGNSSAMLSITWLIPSAPAAFTPNPTTTHAGSIVTSRRTQIGMPNDETLHDHCPGSVSTSSVD